MKKLILIAACLAVAGCKQEPAPPPPKPSIEVEMTDNTEWTGMTVYFRHHTVGQQTGPYVTLNTPQDIQDYKKQVEFLLKRLDEAETKMNIHEPVQDP